MQARTYTSIIQKPLDTISWEDDNFIEELLDVAQLFRPFSEGLGEFIVSYGYQGDLADINSKVTIVEEHETTQAEGAAAGQNYAEMEMMNHPDLKVILTYGTDQGAGANEAAMINGSINKDEFAVFTIDTAEFIRNKVIDSASGESVLRGTVMLGEGTPMTCYKLMDGSWMDRVVDGVYSEECIKITPETIGNYFPAE